MPLHYYICVDLDPAVDDHLPSSSGFIDAFSILLHIIIKIRIVCKKQTDLYIVAVPKRYFYY
jgi:hypothetical protein